MDEEERNKFIHGCRRKCACSYPNCPNRRRKQEDEESENQRTFVSFICETISVIAFIIFGAIVFWLAVAGILVDFVKRLYYSNRYVKIIIGILFSALLLSMSLQYIINSRTYRKHENNFKLKGQTKDTTQDPTKQGNTQKVQENVSTDTVNAEPSPSSPPPPPPPLPPPPPEYMKISLKEKHLENLNGDAPVKNIVKKMFTLSITDEKNREVFKTSKTVFIPELQMEENRPTLIVTLKEILLEDY